MVIMYEYICTTKCLTLPGGYLRDWQCQSRAYSVLYGSLVSVIIQGYGRYHRYLGVLGILVIKARESEYLPTSSSRKSDFHILW